MRLKTLRFFGFGETYKEERKGKKGKEKKGKGSTDI